MDQQKSLVGFKLTILEAKKTHLIASSGKLYVRFCVDNVVVETKKVNATDSEPWWNQTFCLHCCCGAAAQRGNSAVSISDLIQRSGMVLELRLRKKKSWISRFCARSKVVGRSHVSFQDLVLGRPDSWVVMQTSKGTTEAPVLHLSVTPVHDDCVGIHQNNGVLQSFTGINYSLKTRMKQLER